MTDYGASVWVSLYLGTGILWAAWNGTSDYVRREMARGGSWAAFLLGLVLGTLLWPLWAGISLLFILERRYRKARDWDGGDLP
jgi:hypothetical protein